MRLKPNNSLLIMLIILLTTSSPSATPALSALNPTGVQIVTPALTNTPDPTASSINNPTAENPSGWVSTSYNENNPLGQSASVQSITLSGPTNLTINAAIKHQTMNGVGSNINTWSWKGGELRPALDALVDTLGHDIFRVVYDLMEWAGTGSTRPAAILDNLQNLDPATLQSVYEVPDMQNLWSIIAYLNSKGVSEDQIMVNFQGYTPQWMGGSGEIGTPSIITNDAQTNQDVATMIASLVYYGHHRQDVSGANQNLRFRYIAPFNESNYTGIEGPIISPSQMNTLYENIINTLNAMGDTTTRIMGPDTAAEPDDYSIVFSAGVMARMTHFSWHDYGDSVVSPGLPRGGIKADWMTETSKWCGGCEHNQPPTEGEWSFGAGTADILLGDIQNGFSAVLTWEGYDSHYYHHTDFSVWGHVGCSQNGSGCGTSDAFPRVYAIRGRAWPEATIAKAIRPGTVMRELTTTVPGLTALAFYNDATGRFSIVGHNTGGSQVTINGALQNLPAMNSLFLYETNLSLHLQRMNDVAVSNNLFTATIPADTFFYLSATAFPPGWKEMWLPMILN